MNKVSPEARKPVTLHEHWSIQRALVTAIVAAFFFCPFSIAIGGLPALITCFLGLILATLFAGRDWKNAAMFLFDYCFIYPFIISIFLQMKYPYVLSEFIFAVAQVGLLSIILGMTAAVFYVFFSWNASSNKRWKISVKYGTVAALLLVAAIGVNQRSLNPSQSESLGLNILAGLLFGNILQASGVWAVSCGMFRIGFPLGTYVGKWLYPQSEYFLSLKDYFRRMSVQLGVFVIGYLLIILLFSGFYGALYQLYPPSFKGFSEVPSFLEFVYFSIVTATTVGYGDILPVNGVARCLVGLQAIVCLGWVILVFAAVTNQESKGKT